MEIGCVLAFHNHTVEVGGLTCRVGDRLEVAGIPAEVVGFGKKRVLATLIGEPQGLGPGTEVVATGKPLGVSVGSGILGRMLDGLGRPLDGLGPLPQEAEYPLHRAAPPLAERKRAERILPSGLRAVDALLPLAAGQSLALAADAGVGKLTTLAMMARQSSAHSVVFASVGERSTEVLDFRDRDLHAEGMARTVLIAATADAPAAERVKAPFTALAVAEYLRDHGQDVLLVLDSVPRWWAARREMGWSGFGLENLLARGGAREKGTISTILCTDSSPENALSSLTEGHICLTKRVAHSGRYPAIDISQSVSRRFTEIASRQHQQSAAYLRSLLNHYHENEILIENGAYKPGFNSRVDLAIARHSEFRTFLMQGVFEPADFKDTVQRLIRLAGTEQ